MRFSLVMATVDRSVELRCFLDSLQAQSFRDFELIVIDQNSDDRLVPILSGYAPHFPIRHCRAARGLSRARNAGLQIASGDVFGFPDDDCSYPPELLHTVAQAFCANPELDGLTGRPIDPRAHGFDKTSGPLDLRNVFRRGISYAIFLKKHTINNVGAFDESLGLGAESGKIGLEETDYLIRALSGSHRIHYFPEITVFHNDSPLVYGLSSAIRQYGNGLAFGTVLRKHRYPFSFVLYCWLRPLAGSCLGLLTFRFAKARYHFSAFRGRIIGWLR